MPGILSRQDLQQLTGYARATEQRRVLDKEGIPYKTIGTRIIVLSQHIEAWVEGRSTPRHSAPNLSAVT